MSTREISRKLEKIEKATNTGRKTIATFWADQWEALSEAEKKDKKSKYSEVIILGWENDFGIFFGL